MNKTSLSLIALIVVLLGIGIFLGRNDAQTSDEKNSGENSAFDQDGERRKFNLQHSYEDGTHTFAGIINVPTPCHTVEVSSTEDKDGVMVDVAIESSEEGCAQVVTSQSFIYSVIGNEKVNPLGVVSGEVVEINLFPKNTVEEIDLSQFETKG
jgi:hypothetical protein